MLLVKTFFVILHIATAAAWFGLGLRLAGQARTVTSLSGDAARALATELAKSVKLMGAFIVLTAVFALITFFAGGGFAVYTPNYHTALLLILVLVGLQFGLIAPAWRQLTVTAGTSAAEAARKKVAAGVGAGHLLWFVILVLMYAVQLSVAVTPAG